MRENFSAVQILDGVELKAWHFPLIPTFGSDFTHKQMPDKAQKCDNS